MRVNAKFRVFPRKIVELPKLSMNSKGISPTLVILALFAFLSTAVHAQEPQTERPRKVRYISQAKPQRVDPERTGFGKRSIELNRSDLVNRRESVELAQETFKLINLKRMEKGLPELKWSDELAEVARRHSENMATHGFFSHFGLRGRTVDKRAEELGVRGWTSIGENIAFNQGVPNPSGFAVERWMLSQGHKHNLLDSRWKESGLGVAVTRDGKYFFTQVFLR